MVLPPYLTLPNDHYAHAGAPAERWRHVGTLRCGARRFGFEVIAARVHGAAQPALLASMTVTDVSAARQYHKTAWRDWTLDWAQSDPGQPWTVLIGAGGDDGALALRAPLHDPLDMMLEASFVDAATGKPVRIRLRLSQQRVPMLAWGTGRSSWPAGPDGRPPLERYRYAYALTDLKASGTLHIGAERLQVSGLTWMDHEYGAAPLDGPWLRQDMQLSNSIRIVNEYRIADAPVANRPAPSQATVLWPDGNTTVEDSRTTLRMPTWTSPATGIVYFPHVTVEIPGLQAKIEVTSAIPEQELFALQVRAAMHGSVANAEGVFEGGSSSGTAWNGQQLACAAAADGGRGLAAPQAQASGQRCSIV
jgi:predicted secreted hydrolase